MATVTRSRSHSGPVVLKWEWVYEVALTPGHHLPKNKISERKAQGDGR